MSPPSAQHACGLAMELRSLKRRIQLGDDDVPNEAVVARALSAPWIAARHHPYRCIFLMKNSHICNRIPVLNKWNPGGQNRYFIAPMPSLFSLLELDFICSSEAEPAT